jgi:hypothetical protein
MIGSDPQNLFATLVDENNNTQSISSELSKNNNKELIKNKTVIGSMNNKNEMPLQTPGLSSGVNPSSSTAEYTRVRVHIDSITVHNDNDGLLHGDGEWRLWVYVQGAGFLDLAKVLINSGRGDQLWDVSNGETILFPQSATVDLGPPYAQMPRSIFFDRGDPISITTLGYENDPGCGPFRPDPTGLLYLLTLEGVYYPPNPVGTNVVSPYTWDPIIKKFRTAWEERETCLSGAENFDKDDILGTVTKWQFPPYKGTYTAKSTNGDFTMQFTIEEVQYADSDKDGILDSKDNCPNTTNQNQQDIDRDKKGDVCDPDDDNDGHPDTIDNCRGVANPNQNDFDDDGRGDACDVDNDGTPGRDPRFPEREETID